MYLLHILMYVLVRENARLHQMKTFFCVFVIVRKFKKIIYKLTEKIIGGMKFARSTSIKLY